MHGLMLLLSAAGALQLLDVCGFTIYQHMFTSDCFFNRCTGMWEMPVSETHSVRSTLWGC